MATEPLSQLPEKRVKLHPGHTRLVDAPIAEPYKEKLSGLGYVSVEQVVSVARMAPARSRLNAYLGGDLAQILAGVQAGVKAPQLSMKVRTATYRYGVRLRVPAKSVLPRRDLAAARHVPAMKAALAPAATALGNTPDVFFTNMPPIRDQANRGTCVAHAAVAAFEHYLIVQGQGLPNTIDLSEQFLYWNCKAHDGDPNGEGTFLAFAMPLLFSDGCCLETIWPYNPNPIVGNEGQGPPPPQAQPDAATRKAPSAQQLGATSVQDVKDALAAGYCVAVSVAVFDESWLTDEIRSTGNVVMPTPGEVSNEGHAVCLVGYEDLDGEPELGGGRFIVRNSWDSYWGVNCEFGVGYGTMPYSYLTTYGTEAYSIQ
jgi:hypothetical protein